MAELKIGGTYVREWKNPGNKANLVIIHGVGEHSGRYKHVADYFTDREINVYTGDLIGHGRSDGPRVYIRSAEDYLSNVRFLVNRVDDDKPIFILGHSMGGFIVLYYGIRDQDPRVKGIIATSPYIKAKLAIPKWKVLAGKAMGRLAPGFRLENGIGIDTICRDKAVCRAYGQDELNCPTVTAGWFVALEKARRELCRNAAGFYYPCFILQAGEDLIVDPEATGRFFESLQVEDKTLKLYDGFYHEILNDPGKEEAMEAIHSWIVQRL